MNKLRELSLFTGGGGGIYGSRLLGWNTVGYVEWDDYCQRVIRRRIDDGIFDEAPIFGDVRAFNDYWARKYRGLVDVITAGFPCQPFSVAGKRAGADDERNMWPATIECIRLVRPRWCLLENVPGLLTCGYFGRILGDLFEAGYDARWSIISAEDCGAPHRRERLWIVADSEYIGRDASHEGEVDRRESQEVGMWPPQRTANREVDLRILRQWIEDRIVSVGARGDDGVANRCNRLRAIGNGQVPAVVRAAWELLSEYN